MNRLIILASITMMLYGKTQCCISTYNASNTTGINEQYNNRIDCSTNNCTALRTQFKNVAASVTNLLSNILTEFIFDRNVSFNDRSVAI